MVVDLYKSIIVVLSVLIKPKFLAMYTIKMFSDKGSLEEHLIITVKRNENLWSEMKRDVQIHKNKNMKKLKLFCMEEWTKVYLQLSTTLLDLAVRNSIMLLKYCPQQMYWNGKAKSFFFC